MVYSEKFEKGKLYQKHFVERLHLKTIPFFEEKDDYYECIDSFTIEAKIILIEDDV